MLFVIVNLRALRGGILMKEPREGRLVTERFKEPFPYCPIMD
jgi:hypothetical protein